MTQFHQMNTICKHLHINFQILVYILIEPTINGKRKKTYPRNIQMKTRLNWIRATLKQSRENAPSRCNGDFSTSESSSNCLSSCRGIFPEYSSALSAPLLLLWRYTNLFVIGFRYHRELPAFGAFGAAFP